MNLIDMDLIEFVQEKFFKANEAEKQWLRSLNNISHGLMIYNLNENKIIFENYMIANILK